MTEKGDAWHLKGSVVVACNCDFGCPCNFNGLPTTGSCEGGWTWHVDDGRHGDIELAGLNFTLLCKWPGAIHEGNGEAVCMIDERANDDQRAKIQRFLRGEIGGPWAILINTYALHDPDIVPYSVTIDNERSTVTAGDLFDVATEPVRNPVTGVEVHPRAILPEGFIFKEGALLRTSRHRVDSAIDYDHAGRYAAVGPFDYRPA